MEERLRDLLIRHPRAVAAGVAGGAIMLVAVAVGLAIGVFGARPTGEADATPTVQPTPSIQPTDGPSSSPSSTPSSTPTAASGGPVITWSEQSFEGSVDAVTADSGQWVAVGKTEAGLAAWTSPDGVTWERHPVPQPSFLDEYRANFGPDADPSLFANMATMGPLARLGDTLYSFGTFWGAIDFYRPLGWRSGGGTEWQFIESENVFFAGGSIQDLAASHTGLLAARRGGLLGDTSSAWLWTSETSWMETGLTWSPESPIVILDAAWSTDRFVAVGVRSEGSPSTPLEERPSSAASWVSNDGKTWQAAPPSSGLDMAVIRAVSPLPGGGYIAVGCEDCSLFLPRGAGVGDPAAWTSPDGLNWTGVPLPSDREGEALGVVSVENGFVAVGVAGEDTLTWTSSDGTTWRAGPTLPGRFQPKTLVTRDDSVIFILIRGEQAGLPETVLMLGEIQP